MRQQVARALGQVWVVCDVDGVHLGIRGDPKTDDYLILGEDGVPLPTIASMASCRACGPAVRTT